MFFFQKKSSKENQNKRETFIYIVCVITFQINASQSSCIEIIDTFGLETKSAFHLKPKPQIETVNIINHAY